MNEIFLIFISSASVAVITWFISKQILSKDRINFTNSNFNDLKNDLKLRDSEIVDLKVQIGKLEQQIEDINNVYNKVEEKWRKEVETQRKDLETIAIEVLNTATERSQTQLEGAHANKLKQLLEPVEIQFEGFRKKVDQYYGDDLKWRGALSHELEALAKTNLGLNEQAGNLAKALKGDSKVQGDWGEYQLERILEDVGLQKGLHFETQASAVSSEGKVLRPDFLVYLPDNKVLVIDSKVSLTAYERCVNADNDYERESNLKEHIQSMRNHIRGLAKKDYASIYDQSVDYTLMFVPIEPAFFAVGSELQSIQKEGLSSQVLLVSTTTILATLRTVSYIWRQEQQRTNVAEISSRGKKLYEKFVGFIKSMDAIGVHLDRADNSYREAISKLSSGRGNLVSQAEKLRNLGLDVKENIPEKFIDNSLKEINNNTESDSVS